MISDQLKEIRRQSFAKLESRLQQEKPTPQDSFFYYHSSEDRIVLSHAIFWVMTQSFNKVIPNKKYLLLLRQYQEEMLEAYLTEDEYFPELLRYCNVIYELMPYFLRGAGSIKSDKSVRKFAAICIVAAGYAGDMPEEQCDELLDDMDFYNNRVKCPKIEQMLPKMKRLVEDEMQEIR